MKNLKRALLVALAALLLLAATALAENPTAVALTRNELTLTVGGSYTLGYAFTPAGSSDTGTWSAHPANVASVDENGRVSAVAKGTAYVVFLTTGGLSDMCTVTVIGADETPTPSPTPTTDPTPTPTPDPAPGEDLFEVSVPEGTPKKNGRYLIDCGKTLPIYIDATGKWAGCDVGYSTSAKKYATVSDVGLITAKKATRGNAVITVTGSLDDGGDTVSRTLKVHVAPAVDFVKMSAVGIKLYVGSPLGGMKAKYALTASPSPSYANYSSVSWSSNKTNIATVSKSGKVTAVSAGTCKVTATTDTGKSGTCKVTVLQLPSKVALPAHVTLRVGQKGDMKTKLKINGTATDVRWRVADDKIAMITDKGILLGVRTGTTRVRVKTLNGLTDTCTVRVLKAKDLDGGDEGDDEVTDFLIDGSEDTE